MSKDKLTYFTENIGYWRTSTIQKCLFLGLGHRKKLPVVDEDDLNETFFLCKKLCHWLQEQKRDTLFFIAIYFRTSLIEHKGVILCNCGLRIDTEV